MVNFFMFILSLNQTSASMQFF